VKTLDSLKKNDIINLSIRKTAENGFIPYVQGRRRFIMNKEELVKEVSKKAKVSQKAAADILSATLETIEKTVSKGKKVTLVGFGTFESRKRAARTGRNPQTGAALKIAAKTVPAFSAGKKFKELVK
jgi:DNA-binding protein HU-beta